MTGELILEDGCFLGERVHVDMAGGRTPDSRLIVGPASLIGSWVHINTCREVVLDTESAVSPGSMIFTHSFWQSVLDGYPAAFQPVRVGPKAWVGAGCQVLPGVQVGSGAVVMSNSTVVTDIPPHTLAAGVPAKVVRREIRKELSGAAKKEMFTHLLREFSGFVQTRGCIVVIGMDGAFEIALPDGELQTIRLEDGTGVKGPGQLVITVESGTEPPSRTVFNLTTLTVLGPEDRLVFELRNYLRRFGIRFQPYAWRADYRRGL